MMDVPLIAPVRTSRSELVCIRFNGREFIASSLMAGIFLRHVQQLTDDDDAQLIPLLHSGGVDLLFVSADAPLTVSEINSHHSRV